MSEAVGPDRSGAGPVVTRHSLRESKPSLRVLLAEDNQVNQQLAIHMLVRLGHTVRVASTGTEVLEALEREPFDVVLMDIQMPELDGVEATHAIRSREAGSAAVGRVPIIAMTADATVGDREPFLEAGMDGYVSKPVNRDRLQEVLRDIVPQPTDGGDR